MPVVIGILMLMGIVTKNAIMLVDFAIEEIGRGTPRLEALVEAGRKRARPIVMTTIAMAAGMFPSALGLGDGGGFRSPMAIAVIGGLIMSTLLSLVFVPARVHGDGRHRPPHVAPVQPPDRPERRTCAARACAWTGEARADRPGARGPAGEGRNRPGRVTAALHPPPRQGQETHRSAYAGNRFGGKFRSIVATAAKRCGVAEQYKSARWFECPVLEER